MQLSAYSILLIFAFIGTNRADILDVCWRGAFSRSNCKTPHACPIGYEQNGALCYPLCKTGYSGVGPACWENCRPGWTDIGGFCTIPVDIYYPCPWYDICGVTFAKNCKVACRKGYNEIACSCNRPAKTVMKQSYGRTAGISLGCTNTCVKDGGTCFEKCGDGYSGVGQMCWENAGGNATHTTQCNLVTFGATHYDCELLNTYLQKFGFDINECIRPLIASIITQNIEGPSHCYDPIMNVLPDLSKLRVC